MNRFLLAAALLPAVVLMIRVYRLDQIEKEPAPLLFKLFLLGALFALPAALIERLALRVLACFVPSGTLAFVLLENFAVVAVTEELCKRLPVRLAAWNHPAFDYRFDAVVYCVFSALGFAALENVLYVMQFGLSAAISRALLSVPGHFFFAVYMGLYLGESRLAQRRGYEQQALSLRRRGLLVPVLLHGFWDFSLSISTWQMTAAFYLFVLIFFFRANQRLNRAAAEDTPF